MHDLLFYLSGGLALASTYVAVTRRNPFYTALGLLVLFSSLAALFVILASPFVALVQVLLYGGAVIILFVFVIMLLRLQAGPEDEVASPAARIGAKVASLVLFAAAAAGILAWDAPEAFPEAGAEAGGVEALGTVLLGPLLLPFEAASLLLLVAIVGAVVLTRRHAS